MSTEKDNKTFHFRLKEARKGANLTQQKCADLAGVSVQVWGNYERGNIEPGIHKLTFLGEFGISLNELLWGHKSQNPTKDNELIEILQEALKTANEKIKRLESELKIAKGAHSN